MVNSIYKTLGGSPGSEYVRVSVVSGSTSVTQHSEDDPHASGDEGIQVLAVRTDSTAARSDTDGDYEPLQIKNGRLVTTAEVTSSALPTGAATETTLLAISGNTADVATETTLANVETAVTIVGDAVFSEDSASAGGEKGLGILAIRNDAGGSLVSADGDFTFLQTDSQGRLMVSPTGGSTSVTQHLEDDPHASGDDGMFMLAVRNDTPGTLVSTDGDYTGLQVNQNGQLYVDTSEGIATNSGTISARTQRVTIATDDGIATNLSTLAGAVSGTEVQVDVLALPNVAQATHDNLNCNANIQVGDADVSVSNPVPIKNADTLKARLTSAAAKLDVSTTDGALFIEARVVNGSTAQYIQVWDANDETDIATNGVLKEVVYAAANESFSVAPVGAESYTRGIVLVGSSNASALAYTAGANLDFAVVEYVTP